MQTSSNPRIPTSISSSRVTSPLVDAGRVAVDDLVLPGGEISALSHDTTDNDPRHIPSSYSLYTAKSHLDTRMSNFTSELAKLQITPIISDVITPPYFAEDSQWIISSGWRYDAGQAIFRNDSTEVLGTQAVCRLSQKVFYAPGTYFFRIEVPVLESGTLTIQDYTGKQILTPISLPGTYSTQIDVVYPDVYYLEMYLGGVSPTHTVAIHRCYIYKVEDRVSHYFSYIADALMAGDGSGLASTNWVTQQISHAIDEIVSGSLSTINDLERNLVAHVSETNPHQITLETIGAAAALHTHLPDECGAAPVDHTHTPQQCGAAAYNHTHTPEELGAADRVHNHTADECAAAPVVHTHLLADIADASLLTAHMSDTTNPHDVTKAQIGLDNVENYAVADSSDYINRASTKYVTPDGLNTYLEQIFSEDPTLRYTQFAPKKILAQTIILEPGATYQISLNTHSVYEIYLDIHETLGANYLGMSFVDEIFENKQYTNSWNLAHTVDSQNTIGWWQETTDKMYLTPKDVGNNIVRGHIHLDTTLYSLRGEFQTQVGTKTNGIVAPVSSTIYPLTIQGQVQDYTLDTEPATADILLSHVTGRNTAQSSDVITTSIVIFEMVAVGNTNEGIDDAPILSLHRYMGTTAPKGWMIPDGSYILRSQYQQLLAYIQKAQIAVTDTEYTDYLTEHGYCPYFVIRSTTIRLPTIPSTVEGEIVILKTHLTTHPSQDHDTSTFDVIYVYDDEVVRLFGDGPFTFDTTYTDALEEDTLDGIPGYTGELPVYTGVSPSEYAATANFLEVYEDSLETSTLENLP